jgi:hypothetical protein
MTGMVNRNGTGEPGQDEHSQAGEDTAIDSGKRRGGGKALLFTLDGLR